MFVNLWEAPFKVPLRVQKFSGLSEEICLVLTHLGIDEGEIIEKIHAAPLGDPVGLKIGEQIFSLRSEICQKILVEKCVS